MIINVTIGKWYAVSGAAGDTVTSPDGTKTYCTVPEGGQGHFLAQRSEVVTSDDSMELTQEKNP